MLQGVGYVVPPILSIAIVTQWFPAGKQGVPIAIVASMMSLAKVTVLQLSKITIPLGGWHGQFAGCFVMCLVGFVLFLFFVHERPGASVAAPEKAERAPLGVVLRNANIWLIIIVMVAFTIGQRGFSPFSNMIWVDNCGITNDHASDIDSLLFFMQIPSGILFGYIVSHFLKHRGIIVAAMLTVYFVGMSTAFFLDQPWHAWLFAAGVGILGGVPQFCQVCLPLFSSSPPVLSMALAVYDLVGKYLAASVAPYVISSIQTATGSWIYCSVPVFAIGVVAAIACWKLGLGMDRAARAFSEDGAAD